MMRSGVVLSMCVACLAGLAFAKPAAEPVAEGFASWTGVTPKNHVAGRVLEPSDLRQRVTVVVEMEVDEKDPLAVKLGDQLRLTGELARNDSFPAGASSWDELEELPRKCLVVASLNGACTSRQVAQAATTRKGEDAEKNMGSHWVQRSSLAFYTDLKLVGGPDNGGKYPYVYVMGPSGSEPVWKGVYSADVHKEVVRAIAKAAGTIGDWTPLTGVAEPQFFKKEAQDLRQGKPAKPVLVKLKGALQDKNAEKAREAQVMYDAVYQYRSDLINRIRCEIGPSPARAYVDMQQLFVLFPADKKSLGDIDQKLKANKSAATLGKMYEKFRAWNRPDFQFKNAAEAKKAAILVESWKKPLQKIADDQTSTALAGEASLILAQLDLLAESLASKVAQP